MNGLSKGRDGQRFAAAVVTYFPDQNFPERLDKLLEQVSRVVIVDNGSDELSLAWKSRYSERAGLTVHMNESNLGIAAALNQAASLLAGEGYDWVATFDQDSTITSGFISAMRLEIEGDPAPGKVALIGANRIDPAPGSPEHRWVRPKHAIPFFSRVTCDRVGPEGVTLVITSGTLMNVEAFSLIGPFREEYFIDLVDSEYCLRARRRGYRILVCCGAAIAHRVGEKNRAAFCGMTLSPTHHSALRKYYLFRNGVRTIRLHGRAFPHWLVYQFLALAEVVCGVLLFENKKLSKLRACALGIWDGMRGLGGPAKREF